VRHLSLLIAILGAELVASWWLWGGAPTDTLRVSYVGFWSYEIGRLSCWMAFLPLFVVAWLIVWRGLSWAIHPKSSWLFYLLVSAVQILALALEVSTSVRYWHSSSSIGVRNLYTSIWYWHRVPSPSDQGWPSLKGYILNHAFAWVVAILIFEILLYLEYRRRGGILNE